MLTIKIVSKIETLREWEDMQKESAAVVESFRDEIKRHTDAMGTDELIAGTHIIRYTTVLSNCFDSTAFKNVMPDVYKAYTKQTTSHRHGDGDSPTFISLMETYQQKSSAQTYREAVFINFSACIRIT